MNTDDKKVVDIQEVNEEEQNMTMGLGGMRAW